MSRLQVFEKVKHTDWKGVAQQQVLQLCSGMERLSVDAGTIDRASQLYPTFLA